MNKPRMVLFSFVFLVVAFLIEITGVSSSKAFLEAKDLDNAQIKETIYTYFSLRSDAYKSNMPSINFSPIVDEQDSRSIKWLKLEQDIREVQDFIHMTYDEKILEYRFSLDFHTIEVDDDVAIVKLSEDNEITYEHRPTKPSIVANIQHEIWLKQTMDGWIIIKDEYSNDFTKMLKTLSKDTIFENIRRNHDTNHEDTSLLGKTSPIPQFPNTEDGMWLYSYNNVDAVTYADNYYNMNATDGPVPSAIIELDGWNSSWDTVYKEYASDCTNFISQAIFEGVAYTASDPNYFYPDPIHDAEWWYYKFSTVANGSTPWISVGDFYEFLTENYFNYENFGLAYVTRGPAGKGVSLCNIQIGDAVFMYENEGQTGWTHAVIVDDLGANPCNSNDIYVAAHTDDAYQRPLSEYSGYLWYPVEIKGYFNDFQEQLAFFPLVFQSLGGMIESQTSNPYPPPLDVYQEPAISPNPYPEP
jgi:hypothetical protein